MSKKAGFPLKKKDINVTWLMKISATHSLFLLYSTIVVAEGVPDNIPQTFMSFCSQGATSTAQGVVSKLINDMTTHTHVWAFGCGGNIGDPQ